MTATEDISWLGASAPSGAGSHLAGVIPPPQPLKKWPPDIRAEFERLQPHALVVVGTTGPVSLVVRDEYGEEVRRIGGNRGCWPLKLASTGSWKDTVTATYNRSPFFWCGSLIRVWCQSAEHERRLSGQVEQLLDVMRAEVMGDCALEGGFVDVGPDLQPSFLEMEIHALAERLHLLVWDDAGLVGHLEARVRARSGFGAKARSGVSDSERRSAEQGRSEAKARSVAGGGAAPSKQKESA